MLMRNVFCQRLAAISGSDVRVNEACSVGLYGFLP